MNEVNPGEGAIVVIHKGILFYHSIYCVHHPHPGPLP
ncbi:hypothetical protein AAIR98_001520 [Elusimicrobium simillimum]